MRFGLNFLAFTGLALAAPTPQLVNLEAIDALPSPVQVIAPLDKIRDDPIIPSPTNPLFPLLMTPPPAPTPEILFPPRPRQRAKIVQRDGECAAQPPGSGPVPDPDTVEAFASSQVFQAMAMSAVTPDGYAPAFINLAGALSASTYMALYTLTGYDTTGCASKCDQADGCQAFNMYIERDPSVDPNSESCANPPSTTNYKCTLWGAPIVGREVCNTEQYRGAFQVVIVASNGYDKTAPPLSIAGLSGPTEVGGAINAPLESNGWDTYMGFRFFPFSQSQGYDPQTCADACKIQTEDNSKHPATDGTYQTCNFFNAFVLSKDSMPQGLYCSLYNETWDRSYGNNYGQYRGPDYYSVSRSYIYSLSTAATPGHCNPGPAIQNGNFETGVSPPDLWDIDSIIGSTTSAVVQPGSSKNGGTCSYAVFSTPDSSSNGASSLKLSQTMKTCAGTSYSISMDYMFEKSTGACSVMIKYPFGNSQGSVTSPDNMAGTTAGQWGTVNSFFQAESAADVFQVVFDCKDGVANTVRIDNVAVDPYIEDAP